MYIFFSNNNPGTHMRQKRTSRQRLRYPVLHGSEDMSNHGLTKNISKTGLCLKTRFVDPPGSAQAVKIVVDKGDDLFVWGQVRWAMRPPRYAPSTMLGEMGIKITRRGAGFEEFLARLGSPTEEVRETPRYDDHLKVVFNDPETLLEEYTRNISLGGLFVETRASFNKQKEVDVAIYLPGGNKKITVRGKIVYVVTAETAARKHIAPGIGIQIIGFHEGDRDILKQHIEEIRKSYISLKAS